MTIPHRYLSSDILKDVLQSAGYRVNVAETPDGAPILTSATNGLGFEVRLSNPLPNDGVTPPAGAFADASFRTAFQVQGELPLALVNAWNVTHRFARLILAGQWLLLDMDVIALGGVLADNLRAHLAVWDRLVPELIAYLRVELPKLAKAAPVAEPAAPETEVKPDAEAAQ